MNKYHESVKKEIINQFKEGKSIAFLCKEFGLTPKTIRLWLKELGIPTTRKRVSATKDYWNENQENALIEYHKTDSGLRKSFLYKTYLEKPLMAMAESILHRYFSSNLKKIDREEFICDAVTNALVLSVKFSKDKGSAFSYCQTIVKNNYIDRFKKITKYAHAEIDDKNEPIDESFNQFEYQDTIQYLKEGCNERLIKLYPNATYLQKVVIEALLKLLEEDNYNNLYATCFLMRTTGINRTSLYHILNQLNIKIKVQYMLVKTVLKDYLSKHKVINEQNKIIQDWEKEALLNYSYKTEVQQLPRKSKAKGKTKNA